MNDKKYVIQHRMFRDDYYLVEDSIFFTRLLSNATKFTYERAKEVADKKKYKCMIKEIN